MTIVAGIVVVAAEATLGDFIWYTVGVRHTMVAGLAHGALLLVRVGEDDALAHQPVEPALQERSEPLQIVGRQLVDDEEQHQRRASRRRRLRGRGRGRLARGQPGAPCA